MDAAAPGLTVEHIAQYLETIPDLASLQYPRLATDLALVLRSLPSQISPTAILPELVQAIGGAVDPQRAVNHLLRYLENVKEPARFWSACQTHPDALQAVITIFANSQFLSSILWRYPALLPWLLEGALWNPSPTPKALAEQLAECLANQDAEVGDILRLFTYQHSLRIGARDLCFLADVESITADLAALAECVLQAGVEACEYALMSAHGAPIYYDEDGAEHPCHFCVIGMGKLGGYELNFSSDIDLMYVYTSYQGQTRGVVRDGVVHGQISNHEYYVALARRLTTLIGGKGPDGQAFRVDLRLRPEGTQGQLALALLAYEAYYARLGQPWEKMALLKARPVAGSMQLGEEFLSLIQPFVYQRHLDAAGVQQIQNLKQQIDAQMVDRAESRTNVKLGLGGIREIEFLIQLPQLLFGGRRPELQERHSLRALACLQKAGLIPLEVVPCLRETYCYLRRLEHYLQIEQGAQTHTLPQRADQQQRLARHFGYASWECFYEDYLQRTDAIHALFLQLFQAPAVPSSDVMGA